MPNGRPKAKPVSAQSAPDSQQSSSGQQLSQQQQRPGSAPLGHDEKQTAGTSLQQHEAPQPQQSSSSQQPSIQKSAWGAGKKLDWGTSTTIQPVQAETHSTASRQQQSLGLQEQASLSKKEKLRTSDLKPGTKSDEPLQQSMGRGRGRGRGRGQILQQPPGKSSFHNVPSTTTIQPPAVTVQEAASKPQPMPIQNIQVKKTFMESSGTVGQEAASQSQSLHTQETQPKKAAAIEQAVSEIEKLKISESPLNLKIPIRKNPKKAGTRGQPIKVQTNMLEIKFGKRFPSVIYHYDVDIYPEKKKYLYRKVFLAALNKLFSNNAPCIPFDGRKSAYSSKMLDINNLSTTVVVEDNDNRENEYKVTLQIANKLDTSWFKNITPGTQLTDDNTTCLQALNIILSNAHYSPRVNSYLSGRSYFVPPKGEAKNLGGGMDLWLGLFQSAIVGWKPFLNVDVSHKGFFKDQDLIDLIKVVCFENQRGGGGTRQYGNQGPPPRPQDQQLNMQAIQNNWNSINTTISGLRVSLYLHGKKERSRQVVKSLVNKRPAEDYFEDSENRKISVQHYYAQKKSYRIRYPDLPCVMLANDSHVPIEVCKIEPGQTTDKKEIKEKITQSMIKEAATSTIDRKKKIFDAFLPVKHNEDVSLKEFDMSISGDFVEVPARILEPPLIYYRGNKEARVTKGTWRTIQFRETRNYLVNNGTWTILNLNERTKMALVYDFVKTFRKEAANLGMNFGEAKTPFEEGVKPKIVDIQNYLNKQKSSGVRFVIVIFPDRIKSTYATIKQVAELNVGILTQCIKSFTFEKKLSFNYDPATMNNILQKINAKLNGINHSFYTPLNRPKCLERPCMIVGADVTHPSPQMRTEIPSIAAVVASHDPNAQFQYNVEIRLQPPKVEIIQDLENIMKKQLLYFMSKNNQLKPEKIIFYRDGVSEGQFKEVMQKEVTAIRKACLSIDNGQYKPPITFLVVQKRHHTRLFPVNKKDSDDRNFNVKAGTVVDTVVTHPSHIDFYLVSHASIQGTARPTKYRCLWDDSDMSEDEIEQLTYYLCHMFSRCTRSVSYPAPTYYAHLAAFRARNLTEGVTIKLDQLDKEQKKIELQKDILKTPMFFV